MEGKWGRMVDMKNKKQTWQDKFAQTEAKLRGWQEKKGVATLTEIEEAVDKELGQLRRQLIGELTEGVETTVSQEKESLCPVCQTPLQGNGRKKRRLRTKDDQVIELNREQRRCPSCGMTLFPPG
jgi:DNA repair exonuclease SbcCD ATPase subunit